MRIEKKLISTYISKEKFPHAQLVALGLVAFCWIASSFYWNATGALADQLRAEYESVFQQKEYWRLLTTTFIHADLKHLLSNSMMLGILSYFVYGFFGVGVLFLLLLVGSPVVNALTLMEYGPGHSLVGISGVVYMLWGHWLFMYLVIDRKWSFPRRLINVTGIFLILLVPTQYVPNTSYLAHYAGFGVGAVASVLSYPFFAKEIDQHLEWDIRFIPDQSEETVLDQALHCRTVCTKT